MAGLFFKSHRVRAAHGAKKIQSVFCGGVYVAKNTLRGAECRRLANGQPRRRAQRKLFLQKGFTLFAGTKQEAPPCGGAFDYVFRKSTTQYTLLHCYKIRDKQLHFQKKYFHIDPTMQKMDYE